MLSPTDINLAEGVALCPACGYLARLSEVVDETRPDDHVLDEMPDGCSFERFRHGGLRVRVSQRSIGAALGALAVAMFWNGILSIFVYTAICGLYANLIGPLPPLPEWLPEPVGEDGHVISLGFTLFLCVFLIPFVVVGLAMIGAVLVAVAGRIEIGIEGRDGEVRHCVGPVKWKRRFALRDVVSVRRGYRDSEEDDNSRGMRIEAERTIKFGGTLKQHRADWLYAIVHALIGHPDSDRAERIRARAREVF